MSKDYYKILDVPKTATKEEIQKSYRKLARKYHPDLQDDKEKAKQKFQEVQNAYDVLSDPKKRELYDQLGPQFDQVGGRNPFEEYASQNGGTPFGNMDIDMSQIFGQGGGGSSAKAGGFEDFLKQFGFGMPPGGGRQSGPQYGQPHGNPFGRGQQRQQAPAKGRDLEQTVTIPFATAILGGQYQMSVQRADGRIENILISIPAGIDSGKKIRLRGQGATSPNGPQGDLLVKINVAPHPVYARRGNDLHVTVPISLKEAALGAKIDLPSPHGTVTLTIPKSSSGGSSLRLKGMGVQPAKGTKGDLFAHLEIQIPDEISDEDQELIDQLSANWSASISRESLQW